MAILKNFTFEDTELLLRSLIAAPEKVQSALTLLVNCLHVVGPDHLFVQLHTQVPSHGDYLHLCVSGGD